MVSFAKYVRWLYWEKMLKINVHCLVQKIFDNFMDKKGLHFLSRCDHYVYHKNLHQFLTMNLDCS